MSATRKAIDIEPGDRIVTQETKFHKSAEASVVATSHHIASDGHTYRVELDCQTVNEIDTLVHFTIECDPSHEWVSVR